jgi:hypothetical protein
MKKLIIGVTGFAVVALGVFLFAVNKDKAETSSVVPTDIKQMVQDFSSGKSKAKTASITSTELKVVTENSKETIYSLPDDEFFVSIAPYVNQTHPCATHFLTSCRGELASKEFNVYIEDNDGKVVLDQTVKSQPNGFIDLWLPRDQKLNVKISYDGKTTESEISTSKQDNTCITTMQLA